MTILKTKREAKTTDHRTSEPPYFDEFLNYASPVIDSDIPQNMAENRLIPAANVIEEKKGFRLELAVPGFTKSDIRVSVNGNRVLTIKGAQQYQSKESDNTYAREEFTHNSFQRSFLLPEMVNQDEITAACNNGLLTLRLSKKDVYVMKHKMKRVEID